MHSKGVSAAPAAEKNPMTSLSQRKLEPRVTAQPLGAWDGTSGDPAPGSQCLRLFARKLQLQPWSLTMGTLSSSPASLGYRSCCVMGTVFLLLAVADPSSH